MGPGGGQELAAWATRLVGHRDEALRECFRCLVVALRIARRKGNRFGGLLNGFAWKSKGQAKADIV